MMESQEKNQEFIDAAKARGEDTFIYHDVKSGEFLLVSGNPESIRLLTEIIDDYELMSEVVAEIATEMGRLDTDSA